MTENKKHSGGIPKGAFRSEVHVINPDALAEILMPKAYVIDPATKRESAEEAAHDYMRRNIGPSVGTIADRLETAFLAGAQWALTHNPVDEPTQEARKEAWEEGYDAAEINEHEHRPGRKLTNPYTAQRHETCKETE